MQKAIRQQAPLVGSVPCGELTYEEENVECVTTLPTAIFGDGPFYILHVTKKDEVYILGDFAISRGRAANEILSRLNGRKYLVEGNHDKFLNDREFDRSLFQWIKPYAEIMDSKRRVILSHYPIFCYKGQYRTTPEGNPLTYMLYAHVHDTHDEKLVNE